MYLFIIFFLTDDFWTLGFCRMGGSSIDVDCEFTSPLNRTLVLVGRTGNGKSATGNSILQRKAFGTGLSSKGVAKTCEQQRTVLPDGMILNVIDTPGINRYIYIPV